MDSRRRYGAGLFTWPFLRLALAASHDNGFGKRQKEITHINPGKVFVDNPEVLHGTSLGAKTAADAFHNVGVYEGHSLRRRIDFSSPDRHRWMSHFDMGLQSSAVIQFMVTVGTGIFNYFLCQFTTSVNCFDIYPIMRAFSNRSW
jgi:hypothetical protein